MTLENKLISHCTFSLKSYLITEMWAGSLEKRSSTKWPVCSAISAATIMLTAYLDDITYSTLVISNPLTGDYLSVYGRSSPKSVWQYFFPIAKSSLSLPIIGIGEQADTLLKSIK